MGARPRGVVLEIDGLRGIAILFVLFHHFWPAGAPGGEVAHLGWIGVDLFYVISGYLITGILIDTVGEQGYYRNYLARRGLRVFPLYYLFLLAAFLLIPRLEGGDHSQFVQQSGSPAWYAFYLGNVREAITGHEPGYVLAPLWSLSIEEQFYLTFPFVVAFLKRATLRNVLGAMVLIAPMFRIAMMFAFPDNERIQYLATPSRMDVLALGCLLALYHRSDRPPLSAFGKRMLGYALIAAVAELVVAFVLGGLDRTQWFGRAFGYTLVAIAMLMLVFWTLEHRNERATAFLRFRPLMALGKLCYGIYLLQRPAEVILLKLLGRFHIELGAWPLMFAKFGAAIALATASWVAFEEPILRLKKRFESKNHPLVASPA